MRLIIITVLIFIIYLCYYNNNLINSKDKILIKCLLYYLLKKFWLKSDLISNFQFYKS